jgi:hypothetical protein
MGAIDRIEFSDEKVTAWGGMQLMKQLLDKSGVKEKLNDLPLPERGSNRSYASSQIVECFWTSIWIGAGRFSHSSYLRYDDVLKKIFGWSEAPSQSTYSRFFNKFDWKRNEEIFAPLQEWFFNQIQFDNLTLDLDSSVITRYGEQQEGAKKGYNAKKPGRLSHHPLMAFIPELRMVANAWLRPGNTGALSNAENFLDETLHVLGNKKVGLVRCDSGFYGEKFIQKLEKQGLNYVIAVKFYPTIKEAIRNQKKWVQTKDGIEVCEFEYQPTAAIKPRKYIAVRKNIRILTKATGKLLLFEEEQIQTFRYSVYVSNVDLPAEHIWNIYKHRADAENKIKELKYDFALDSFCVKNFWGTEAAFRMIMMAYNLMALFRQICLQSKKQSTLNTLRFKCFALGAWITQHSRITTLKISAIGEKRRWLDALFDIIPQKSPPFHFSNA